MSSYITGSCVSCDCAGDPAPQSWHRMDIVCVYVCVCVCIWGGGDFNEMIIVFTLPANGKYWLRYCDLFKVTPDIRVLSLCSWPDLGLD